MRKTQNDFSIFAVMRLGITMVMIVSLKLCCMLPQFSSALNVDTDNMNLRRMLPMSTFFAKK